jgi:ABC-type multidrug transport system ATPase subunit
LEIADLAKRFGGQVALNGCAFTVEPGRLTGLLGPTGAGTTTALRCVMGLVVAWRLGAPDAAAPVPVPAERCLGW